MIFAVPGHIEKIVRGEKTQTRRLAKPGEWLYTEYPTGITAVIPRPGHVYTRARYETGRDYAVQPGRCKPGVWWAPPAHDSARHSAMWCPYPEIAKYMFDFRPLRIRVLSIVRENVRQITETSAQAEGGYTRESYLALWLELNNIKTERAWHKQSNFDVWVLTFEVTGKAVLDCGAQPERGSAHA